MTAEEIRKQYKGGGDLQDEILAEIAAQLAEQMEQQRQFHEEHSAFNARVEERITARDAECLRLDSLWIEANSKPTARPPDVEKIAAALYEADNPGKKWADSAWKDSNRRAVHAVLAAMDRVAAEETAERGRG